MEPFFGKGPGSLYFCCDSRNNGACTPGWGLVPLALGSVLWASIMIQTGQ